MSYGEFKYQIMKDYPEELNALGLTPVFVPKQDGYLPHYALLDKDQSEVYAGDLVGLVGESTRRIEEHKKNIATKTKSH